MARYDMVLVLGLLSGCSTIGPDAPSESAKIAFVPTAANCAALTQLQLPDVRITESAPASSLEGAGNMRAMGEYRKPADIKAPHCRVTGVIDRETNFILLLPDNWNRRFYMGGGGGYVGEVTNQAAMTVTRGYATVGTDTGHKGGGQDATWALNNVERQLNFGYLAIHRTAEVSKAIVRAYYRANPAYSYFDGYSRGGGQAMHEALRYPDDFDGILAGAPAMDWTGFAGFFLKNSKAIFPDSKQTSTPVVTPENRRLLETKILDACDALDGVKDGVMEDPRQCKFDIASIPSCKAHRAGPDCFTKAQRTAIKAIYAPLKNKNGQIFPGQPYGAEDEPGGWESWLTGTKGKPGSQWFFATEFYKNFVFSDPNWDYAKYDFSTWNKDNEQLSTFMNATDPDLSAFKAKGHKLIIYDGWSDQAQTPLRPIQYFEQVEARDRDVRSYVRLFLLPGVTHGGGGAGPGYADWTTVIADWVEHEKAPDRVIVSKFDRNHEVTRTRPICVYPEHAAYVGNGSIDDEHNFVCR